MEVLLWGHGGDGGATAILVRCHGGHGGAAATPLRIGPTRVEREPRTVIHVKRAKMFDPMG